MDSELNLSHTEFQGKNITYKEFIDSSEANPHGTAISSLIIGNNLGVAPKAELVHAKMLSNDYGSGYAWDRAFTYVLQQDVDIICMSIGTKASLSPSMRQSLQDASDKGIIILAPSGNEGKTLLRNPANNKNVMAIGGITLDKKISKKSNRSKHMEGYAPSENVIVAYNGGEENPPYTTMSGTSFANAIFTGQVALILSYARKIGIADFKTREFIREYNKKHRRERKILNMEKVKKEIDSGLLS